MASSAEFPLEVFPLVTVFNVEQAAIVTKNDYDVLIMYAARRNRKVLEALASPDKRNLMFVRRCSSSLLIHVYWRTYSLFARDLQWNCFERDELPCRNVIQEEILITINGVRVRDNPVAKQ